MSKLCVSARPCHNSHPVVRAAINKLKAPTLAREAGRVLGRHSDTNDPVPSSAAAIEEEQEEAQRFDSIFPQGPQAALAKLRAKGKTQ